ncbi:MAG: hypothetical protein MK207_12520 [Saprospiraceae bacterium]|nr:hypothetical protein [Saprospiraceae bacterium]
MKKVFAFLKYIFRKRLWVSSQLIDVKIKDFSYSLSKEKINFYNEVVSNHHNHSKFINKADFLHPVVFAKINWQMIQNLNNFLEKKINPEILETLVHQSEQIILNNIPKDLNKLVIKSKLIEISKHKRGTKLAIKFEYFVQDNIIATEFSSAILFGVKLHGKDRILEQMPWPEKINRKPIWTEHLRIEKDLPYKYAEKAEIDAAIHTDPVFAKSLGLPDIILQGTCTFAKSLNTIIQKELNNDYSNIQAVSARFTGHVVTPNILKINLLKQNEKSLNFNVTTKQNKVVIKGGTILLK